MKRHRLQLTDPAVIREAALTLFTSQGQAHSNDDNSEQSNIAGGSIAYKRPRTLNTNSRKDPKERDNDEAKTIYLEGVAADTDSEKIKQYIETVVLPGSKIDSIELPLFSETHPMSRQHGKCATKGFAFIVFNEVKYAQQMLDKHIQVNNKLNDKRISGESNEKPENITESPVNESEKLEGKSPSKELGENKDALPIKLEGKRMMLKSQWLVVKEKFLKMQRKSEYNVRASLCIN